MSSMFLPQLLDRSELIFGVQVEMVLQMNTQPLTLFGLLLFFLWIRGAGDFSAVRHFDAKGVIRALSPCGNRRISFFLFPCTAWRLWPSAPPCLR